MQSKLLLYKKFYSNCNLYCFLDGEWNLFPEDYANNRLHEVKTYLITFKDGQILDYEDEESDSFPAKCYFIEDRGSIDKSNLPYFDNIIFNSNSISCTHSKNVFSKYDEEIYQTTIKNIGNKAFKINRFSAYYKSIFNKFRKSPNHSSMIDGWYSDNDFKMWYQQKRDWVLPNEEVSDYRNYGDNCFWIYEVEFQNGKIEFIAFEK